MTAQVNKEKIEEVALVFAAQLIDNSNGWESARIDDELMKRATSMAIDWVQGEDLRSDIVYKTLANWVDLSEVDDIESYHLEEDKEYWFVALPFLDNGTFSEYPKVVKAKVKTKMNANPGFNILAEDSNLTEYRVQYFLTEEDGENFDNEFRPELPYGVIFKGNGKFQPYM